MKTQFDHFFTQDALDSDGRVYLCDRGLHIPVCQKAGIGSAEGKIYFAYRHNGEIVRTKYRSMKDKKDTKFNYIAEKERETFRMPFFNQQTWPTNDYLIITEGEFDCIALLQLTGCNVVSLPNGATSLESTFRNHYEYLQQFKVIYLCMDMDEAGDKAAKKAMSLISPGKYRRLILPCKDANEWIMKNPEVELVDLQMLMLNAQSIQDKSFTDIRELDDDVYNEIRLGASTGWSKLDEILGGLRVGEVTVISADTGSGKSTFCINLLYNLASQFEGVWINSYEMHYKIVSRKLASFVLKKKMKFEKFKEQDKSIYLDWLSKHRCFINKSTSKVDLQSLRKQFEIASYAYDIKYIFIDHLDYIHSAGKKNTLLENIDDSMRELHSLAMEFNVSVILVVHPKQIQNASQ